MSAPFDIIALETWLEAHVDGFRGPLEVRRFNDGQSNPTFLLANPTRKYVLRKKPDGVLLPSAHAVEREYRVMRALQASDVPVPEMLHLCEDASVIGTTFFVMSHVEGRIFWKPALPELTTPERSALYDDMNRVIANLHDVDYQAAGLGDFGRPGSYLERQVARWSKQYRASETQPIEAMDRLIEWLPKHLPPPGATTIVHGDLRLDNMIIHPPRAPRGSRCWTGRPGRLGDPLADFRLSHADVGARRRQVSGNGRRGDLVALGIPDAEPYFRLYARAPRARRNRSLVCGIIIWSTTCSGWPRSSRA